MSENPRASDPILDELHAVRRKMHDECGGELAEIVARMRQRQDKSGHPRAATPVPRTQMTQKGSDSADDT